MIGLDGILEWEIKPTFVESYCWLSALKLLRLHLHKLWHQKTSFRVQIIVLA
jgi:hypothetical protein